MEETAYNCEPCGLHRLLTSKSSAAPNGAKDGAKMAACGQTCVYPRKPATSQKQSGGPGSLMTPTHGNFNRFPRRAYTNNMTALHGPAGAGGNLLPCSRHLRRYRLGYKSGYKPLIPV